MPLAMVVQRLKRVADEAKRQFEVVRPGEGAGWWCVPVPACAGLGTAAVGVGRSPGRGAENNWRLLAFTDQMGADGEATLKALLGTKRFVAIPAADEAGVPKGQAWLATVLSMSRDSTEAAQRLWVILTRTNAFRLG